MPDTLERKVGARLLALRKHANLTARALALRAVITPEMVTRIEKGSRTPRLETLEKLCAALDISLADFFAFDMSPPAVRGVRPFAKLERQLEQLDAGRQRLVIDALTTVLLASSSLPRSAPKR